MSLSKYRYRIKKAQSHSLDLETICPALVREVIRAHSNNISVPYEYIFYPLLTTIASLIGVNGKVKVRDGWTEPSCFWVLVAARKGEKKTACANLLKGAVRKHIEEDIIQREWTENGGDASGQNKPPKLQLDHFSFEALHSCLCRTQGNALLLYDEITMFFQLIDHYKTGSLDRKTLLSLYGGGEWSREFKNGSATVKQTAAQIAGYIQPLYFCKMAEEDDVDAFNDRFVIVCPQEKEAFFDDFVDLPEQYRNSLGLTFQEIYIAHETPREYSFDVEGLATFKAYHDDLVNRKRNIPDDENRRGILSKAKGQTARLAMILHVLQQGLAATNSDNFEWETEINTTTMTYATTITNYLIAQKFELMPPEIRLASTS